MRAVDIRTGKDFGPGSVQVQASVPGDGKGSVNGQIPFDPFTQNQRQGLVALNGMVLVAWGSFSDFGVYHGWLMAFDAATLQQKAVFNPTTKFQAVDTANGPADHGGGGSFWGGGASPAIDSNGNIYEVAADGSFNADGGGTNMGDTVIKLALSGNGFSIIDWFSPSNQACLNEADLEIGSGGVAVLPAEVDSTRRRQRLLIKEGRLYILNLDSMGHFNAAGDTQIPQMLQVGNRACFTGMEMDSPRDRIGSVYTAMHLTGTRTFIWAQQTARSVNFIFKGMARWQLLHLRSHQLHIACVAPIRWFLPMVRRTAWSGLTKRAQTAVRQCCTHMTPL